MFALRAQVVMCGGAECGGGDESAGRWTSNESTSPLSTELGSHCQPLCIW